MLSVIDSLVLTLTTRILIPTTSLWTWLDGSRRATIKKLTPRQTQVDRFPSKPGFTNHAHQPPPGIGRQRIAMVEPCGIDNERLVGRQHAEVGVESRSDLPLLTKAGQSRRPLRHPGRDRGEGVTSPARSAPNDG